MEPALLVFPCDGEVKEFAVVESLRARHAAAYPSLDVLGEYRRALVWVEASPENRKTARGMGRFLVRWLGRAQNDRGSRAKTAPPASSAAASPLDAYCDWHREPGHDEKASHRPKATCPSCKHQRAKNSGRPGGASSLSDLDDPLPDWAERNAR